MNAEQLNVVRSLLEVMRIEEDRIVKAMLVLQGERIKSGEVLEEPLLSPKQLSARIGVSLVTLWRMQPPYIRVGARKRFEWSEVRAFLDRKTSRLAK